MMKGLCVVMAVLVHMAAAGPPPPQCRGPPPTVEKPHECCKVPSIFKEEDFKACGFKKMEGPPPPPPGPPPMDGTHGRPEDCKKPLCLMKKYDILKADETIDKEAIGKILEAYADENPDFKPAVEKAQARCLDSDLEGPPEMCEAHKLMFCMTTVLFANCPASVWQDTDNCSALKKHMEECSPFSD